MAKIQKYYVSKNGRVLVQCLSCKRARSFSIEKPKIRRNRVMARCPCGHSFPIDLEFRQNHRQKVSLSGTYSTQGQAEGKAWTCSITDLAMGGLSFVLSEPGKLKKNEDISISFKLKDALVVERTVRIRYIRNRKHIGGEFIDARGDSALLSSSLF